jgi:hypothetical protein
MKKSETIIVSLVFIAAVYGIVDFSLARHRKEAASVEAKTDSQGLTELNTQISALAANTNSKFDQLAASINEAWPETTFVLKQAVFGHKEVDPAKDTALNDLQTQANQLLYSGFLSMGTDLIAIINGMDYKIGEQVNGFTIIKITQESIQLTQKDATFTVQAVIEKVGN